MWPSKSSDINPNKHSLEILDRHVINLLYPFSITLITCKLSFFCYCRYLPDLSVSIVSSIAVLCFLCKLKIRMSPQFALRFFGFSWEPTVQVLNQNMFLVEMVQDLVHGPKRICFLLVDEGKLGESMPRHTGAIQMDQHLTKYWFFLSVGQASSPEMSGVSSFTRTVII